MKCSACNKNTNINRGNAYLVLYETCSKDINPNCNLIYKKDKNITFDELGNSEEVYILRESEQDGPYNPTQIVNMWNSGQIKMNHKIRFANMNDWIPAAKILSKTRRDNTYKQNTTLLRTGYTLLLVGLVTILYFVLQFDTSVATNVSSSFVPSRVENIGLLHTRLNGIIIGAALSVIGAIFIAFGHMDKQ